MINENELSRLLFVDDNKLKKNNNTLFGSPLKKFINNIYNTFQIPKESFIISLYYLYNFYNINKDNIILINDFFDNINIFFFTCLVISLKQLHDEVFNVKLLCNLLNIKYDQFTKYEFIILKGINWNTSYATDNFIIFKNYVELHLGLQKHMDYLD
jgi:hypothetical protein